MHCLTCLFCSYRIAFLEATAKLTYDLMFPTEFEDQTAAMGESFVERTDSLCHFLIYKLSV